MHAALLLLPDRAHLLDGGEPAEALLVRDGRIAAVGAAAEVHAAAPAGTRVLRLPGVTLTPGITDAHVHLTAWAVARRRVQLADAPTLADGLARIRGYARAHSSAPWVLGLGWDLNRWGELPRREALDEVVRDRPAYLESHDTHAAWLNTEALQRCGITRATPDPEGGRIVRDPDNGEPTGVLLENAKALAGPYLPSLAGDELESALLDAQREAHALGITGVHSVESTGLADFSRLERDDRLRLRVLQHLPLAQLEVAADLGLRSGWRSPGTPGSEEGWIRLGGVKLFLDGALGSRTAWLRQPYEGTAGDFGIATLAADEFRAAVRRMAGVGLAATVHAIGDAAVELALAVLTDAPAPAALPHRIEHLQLCPPDLWDRAAGSGIVASMQPVHLRSDIDAAERHWGHDRARGAYAFAPLLRRGMTLAFGSDVPVETLDPRQGLFAAVRRVSWEGEPADGWYPEHGLTAEQALRAYTVGAAAAAGEAHRRGRLLPGFDADLVGWDRDPLGCEAEELLEMGCVITVVRGELVHQSGAAG